MTPARKMALFSTSSSVRDDPRQCGYLRDQICTLRHQNICGSTSRLREIAGDRSRSREIVGDCARYNRIYFDSGACILRHGDIHTAWDRPAAMRESQTVRSSARPNVRILWPDRRAPTRCTRLPHRLGTIPGSVDISVTRS